MSAAQNNNNGNQGASAGIGMGIGAGISTAMSNLWQARQNRINRKWSEDQTNKANNFNIQDRELRWARENDWQYQVAQWKKAGLNPYAMLGQGVNAPASSSAQPARLEGQGSLNFDGIGGAIQTAITMSQQMKLINAQIEQTNAMTEKARSETTGKDIENQFAALSNYLDINQKQAAISNMEQTTENLKSINHLQNQQVLSERSRTGILQIQESYENEKLYLQNLLTGAQTNYTQQQVRESNARIAKMGTEVQKLKSDIELNQGNVKLIEKKVIETQENTNYLQAKTKTENDNRDANRRNIERSNTGPFAPLWKMNEKSESQIRNNYWREDSVLRQFHRETDKFRK